ncbi:ABC transporter permease, partial [Escherichia coli]|nr:ABC transporter permease [Escherichia coli]
PAYLSKNATMLIMSGKTMDYFIPTILITAAWIILLVGLTVLMIKIKALPKTE